MVEVQFKFSESEKYGKDHFLSLRVGECQRIARVNANRTFKFPASAVGTRKYGKVEVYRRVGSSTISIDPNIASGANEVEVSLDTGALVSLMANVVTTDAKGLKKEQDTELSKEPKGMAESPSHRAVSDYLAKHHLEVRLADAMQKVLRERPENPAEVLAQMLVGNADKVAKLPTPSGGASPPPLPSIPASPPASPKAAGVSLKASAPPLAEAAAPPAAKSTPPAAEERAVVASRRPLLPSMGSFNGPMDLYGGMCRYKPVAASSTPKAQVEAADYVRSPPAQFLPSMGTYHGTAGMYGGVFVFKSEEQTVPAPVEVETPAYTRSPPAQFLPSMGTYHGTAGMYGGVFVFKSKEQAVPAPDKAEGAGGGGDVEGLRVRVRSMVVSRYGEAEEEAAPSARWVAPEYKALPSMASYNGPVGLHGGIVTFKPVAASSSSVPSAAAVNSASKVDTTGRLLPSMGGCQTPAGVYGGTLLLDCETPRFQNMAPALKLPSVATWMAYRPFPSEEADEDNA